MAFLSTIADETDDDVAKRAPINEAAVRGFTDRLRNAGIDQSAFDRVFGEMKSDASLKAGDIIEIAARYTRGRKPTSKGAALAAIAKQIVQLISAESRAQRSAKARLL